MELGISTDFDREFVMIEDRKRSLEQIAASRERSQADGEWIKDLSPDELELVGQILKQYLV